MSSPSFSSRAPLARLAAAAFRRRRAVVVAWVGVLAAAVGLLGQLAGDWSADFSTPGSDSRRASDLLAERFPERSADTVDVVWQAEAGAMDPSVRARVSDLLADAQRHEGVGDGVAVGDAQIAPGRDIAVARLPLTEGPVEVPLETGEALLRLADEASADGLRVELAGQAIANAQQSELSSETVGLVLAAIILLFTFGSVVAAGLPIATALFGLGVSSGLIGVAAAVIDVPDWAPAMAAMLGIGVGIDYALLVVTRYRSALAAGRTPREATIEAVATAGRSVLVAGMTVVISLIGLFVMGLTYLYGAAIASIVAVLVVMAASVTLLPALLGFAGRRIDRLHVGRRRPASGVAPPPRAAGWARTVQRRPRTAGALAVLALLAMALPAAGLRIGFPDGGNDPEGTSTRAAYGLISQGFGPGANGPLMLVAELEQPADGAAFERLAGEIRGEPGIEAVQAPVLNRAGDTAVMSVQPEASPQADSTRDLIERLREGPLADAAVDVAVGGSTAAAVDQSDATAARLPLFIGAVVGLSFLLLLVTFRSVLVPVKAAVMNLLSVGAAYGVVAHLAEGGFMGELVGIDSATPVAPFIPILIFAVLFGLSMDYEVFLMSRVREEFLSSGDSSTAVTAGLARTARVITAAAAIMVAVFAAFALSDEVFLKLIGLGLAAAIFIDATVVRMVLAPAVMQLLGDRSWWLPAPLARVLPAARAG
jgi:putative drug exporter of the RND superfamily